MHGRYPRSLFFSPPFFQCFGRRPGNGGNTERVGLRAFGTDPEGRTHVAPLRVAVCSNPSFGPEWWSDVVEMPTTSVVLNGEGGIACLWHGAGGAHPRSPASRGGVFESLLGPEWWSRCSRNAATLRIKRRGWDSNPRYGCPHTRFPVAFLQPLGHLSR